MQSVRRRKRSGGFAGRSLAGLLVALGLVWGAPVPVLALLPIGVLEDTDSDLVPDEFDNCVEIPNGPQQRSNQVDTDRDGYGNACDADYSSGPRDFEVTTADFAIFLYAFTGARPDPETDHDGDGETTASDMAIFLRQFQGEAPLGPGLPCAGSEDCLP